MNKKAVYKSIIYSLLVFLIVFGAYFSLIKNNFFDEINPLKKVAKLYEQKKYLKVIEEANKLLQHHSDSIELRRFLWKSYLVLEQFNKSLLVLSELENLLPKNNIEVLFAHCTLFKFMKQYDKAIMYCEKALLIKPNKTELKIEVAKILIEKRDLEYAENYINNNFEDSDFNKILLLANIKTLDSKYEESIKILEQLRIENPNEYSLYYYLANNYIQIKDYLRASGYLEEFTSSFNAENVETNILEDAYKKLATCYETNKMYAKAYNAYKEASCFSLKLQKTDNAILMIKKAIAISFMNFRGFVSEKDFEDKFNALKKELEQNCEADLFSKNIFSGE